MKKLFAMCILSICVLCSLKGSGRQPVANASLTPKDSITKKIPIAKPYTESNSPIEYQASVYDQSHYTTQIANHKKSLKELSDQKVFIAIAEEVSKSLPQKAREYFKNKPDYELLSFAIGNLFQEKSDDGAFIVYDKKIQEYPL